MLFVSAVQESESAICLHISLLLFFKLFSIPFKVLPRWHWWWRTRLAVRATWERWLRSLGWEGPWRRAWQPTPVFFPGEPCGQRSLVGYGPCGVNRVRQNLETKQQPQWQHLLQVSLSSHFEVVIPPSKSVTIRSHIDTGHQDKKGKRFSPLWDNLF